MQQATIFFVSEHEHKQVKTSQGTPSQVASALRLALEQYRQGLIKSLADYEFEPEEDTFLPPLVEHVYWVLDNGQIKHKVEGAFMRHTPKPALITSVEAFVLMFHPEFNMGLSLAL